MKKQNTNNKLAFNKAAVTELNENQMEGLNGGTIYTTSTRTSFPFPTITFTLPRTTTVTFTIIN
jgi:hypothetical protein